MAQNDDLKSALLTGVDPLAEVNVGPVPEITWEDRLILNNLFDTQPAKRAAYLRQKGFEINPKDDNTFRPIGSKGGYHGVVDPSYHEAYQKGGVSGVMKELMLDAGDVGYDTGVSLLSKLGAAGGGAATGGEMGAVAGPAGAGVGAVLGGLAAGIGSGAISNAAAETLKAGIGNIFLNEHIPQNMKATAVQSLLMGATPYILKGAGQGISWAAQKARINSVVKGIENAAFRFSGGQLDKDILQKAATEPEMFDPKNVEKVGAKLNQEYSNIWGLDPEKAVLPRTPDAIKPGSLIGNKMFELNNAANEELSNLSKNPDAQFTLRDVLGSFQQAKQSIENKGTATAAEEAGIKEANRYQKDLMNLAKKNLKDQGIKGDIPKSQLLNTPLSFDQVYNVAKTMKNAALDENVHGSEMLAQIAGSGPGQLTSKLNQRSMALGSNWHNIQNQRYGLLDMAERVEPLTRPNRLASAFLGGDTSPAKAATISALNEFDSHLGTNLADNVKRLDAQKAFADFYRNPDVYSKSNPLFTKIGDVAQATKQGGFGAGISEAASLMPTRLRPGENLADLYSKRLGELNGGINQSFMDSMSFGNSGRFGMTKLQVPGVSNVLENLGNKVGLPGVGNVANVAPEIGLAASKRYLGEPQQSQIPTPSQSQAPAAPSGDDELMSILLKGVK